MKNAVPERQDWLSRRSIVWASYDVASSVYIGVAPAVLAPLYFREIMGDFGNPTAAWGILAAVAVLVSSVAALAAAWAAGRMPRLTLLSALTAGLLLSIAALAWTPQTLLTQAMLAFVAAQSFYFAAMTIYESYLPDIAAPASRQMLSGFGWAAGYLGGLLAIIVLLVIVADRPQSAEVLVLCFTALAVMSAGVFGCVLLLMRKEGFGELSVGTSSRLQGVSALVRHWRDNPGVFQLLLATILIQMVVFVVVTFTAPILADRFGQNLQDLLRFLLIIHIVAVPATLAWSRLIIGASRVAATLLLLASWGLVLLLLAFGSGPWMPLVTITVIGCCLGATFSGLRGFLAESAGRSNPVALFALATVGGRMAAALGPALFSLVTMIAGEQVALLSMLPVLACGAGMIVVYIRRDRAAGAARRQTLM